MKVYLYYSRHVHDFAIKAKGRNGLTAWTHDIRPNFLKQYLGDTRRKLNEKQAIDALKKGEHLLLRWQQR